MIDRTGCPPCEFKRYAQSAKALVQFHNPVHVNSLVTLVLLCRSVGYNVCVRITSYCNVQYVYITIS